MAQQKQARSWAEIKVAVNRLGTAAKELPAPPTPRDSWSEKVNALNRAIEGLNEQLNSEIESEDLRLERESDGE